jgi:hypothetical protein
MTDPASNHPILLLTHGGPTYRIEMMLGLVRDQSPRIVRRAMFSVLITWVPLLVLAALQGTAIGHNVTVTFLRDFAVHARFILAIPLLIVAGVIIGPRLAKASLHFVQGGLVVEEDFERFDSAVQKGHKLRDSVVAELVLVGLAYAFTLVSAKSMGINSSTWHGNLFNETNSLTWAGCWFALFCVPLFQFLVFRWLWRLFLWGQFLWRMSKLRLQLIPTHPDEAGGLAFVGKAHRFFATILFAVSIATAGVLANNIVYDHIPLPHFGPAIAFYVIVAVSFVLAPLFVFAPILLRTKMEGQYRYSTFATEYTSSFQKKWIEAPHPREETLLGTGDIQSLADLGNSFSFVEKMNPLPMGPRTPIVLATACLIPMLPLLLTMMSLKDIVRMLLKFVV